MYILMFELVFYICNIVIAHTVADFVFQTDEQAQNKSTSVSALNSHIKNYAFALTIFMLPSFAVYVYLNTTFLIQMAMSLLYFLTWVFINAELHFLTDFVSSKMTKKAWEEGNRHKFFCIIGFDQMIHILTLIGTLVIMLYFG